jgi:hypothetical protein
MAMQMSKRQRTHGGSLPERAGRPRPDVFQLRVYSTASQVRLSPVEGISQFSSAVKVI